VARYGLPDVSREAERTAFVARRVVQ
jgi:hypothetical protein